MTPEQLIALLLAGQYPQLPQAQASTMGSPALITQGAAMNRQQGLAPIPSFSQGSLPPGTTTNQGSPALVRTGQQQMAARQKADPQMLSVGRQQLPGKQNNQQGGYITHVVKPGDTLWGIAHQYTGNGDNWTKLQGFHQDPRTLAAGTVIHVPKSLMQGQNLQPSKVYSN